MLELYGYQGESLYIVAWGRSRRALERILQCRNKHFLHLPSRPIGRPNNFFHRPLSIDGSHSTRSIDSRAIRRSQDSLIS